MTEHAGVGVGLAIIPTDRLDILWAKISHSGQYSVVFAYVRVLHRERTKLLKTFKGLYGIGEVLVFLMASESMIKNRTVVHYSNAYILSHHNGWA